MRSLRIKNIILLTGLKVTLKKNHGRIFEILKKMQYEKIKRQDPYKGQSERQNV